MSGIYNNVISYRTGMLTLYFELNYKKVVCYDFQLTN